MFRVAQRREEEAGAKKQVVGGKLLGYGVNQLPRVSWRLLISAGMAELSSFLFTTRIAFLQTIDSAVARYSSMPGVRLRL